MVRATSALDSRWSNSALIAIVAVAGETFSFSVSPSGVAFGNQMLNTASAPKSVTLTNTGSEPQPVYGRVNGSPGHWQDFTLTNDCPSKLPWVRAAHSTSRSRRVPQVTAWPPSFLTASLMKRPWSI